MSTKIRIHITKDILYRSCMCSEVYENNCAIALAIRDIFPNAAVYMDEIHTDRRIDGKPVLVSCSIIALPAEASQFIGEFDQATPSKRLDMKPFDFEIEISDPILEECFPIPEELNEILSSSPTLELVE